MWRTLENIVVWVSLIVGTWLMAICLVAFFAHKL